MFVALQNQPFRRNAFYGQQFKTSEDFSSALKKILTLGNDLCGVNATYSEVSFWLVSCTMICDFAFCAFFLFPACIALCWFPRQLHQVLAI